MASTCQQRQVFRFLDLPLELRHGVYEYVFFAENARGDFPPGEWDVYDRFDNITNAPQTHECLLCSRPPIRSMMM